MTFRANLLAAILVLATAPAFAAIIPNYPEIPRGPSASS